VSPVNDAPRNLSATPQTQTVQYSDPITSVAISATDIDSPTMTASTTWKKSTDALFTNTIPLGGLSLSGSSGSWTLSGRALVPEGTYIVRVTISDGAASNYIDVTITVTKEDMTLTYTGQSFVSTSSVNGTTSVAMAALVEEASDGNLGTVPWSTIPTGGLKVKFTIYSSTMAATGITCTANVAQTSAQVLVGKGTAGCSVSGLRADQYIIQVELVSNGYYVAPVQNICLTVTDPGTGFTTGGGWFTDPNTNDKSNFGFTVKYLKNGQIQGNSLFIYRSRIDLGPLGIGAPSGVRDYNFIVKSNAMDSLVQKCATPAGDQPCKATFTGKSNLKAVDRSTGIAYAFGSGTIGNQQSFQVDVNDVSEPGSSPGTGPDSYAIRIWTSNGTYYQVGIPRRTIDDASAVQVPITGGNIQVRMKPA
jgi:hypothetical protein